MSTSHTQDFFIQWHLTERCNLRCTHCYQTGTDRAEMALSEIKEAVCEASDTLTQWQELYGMEFSPSFNITGGEPLLRPDLREILSFITDKGIDIYLLTNGTMINRKKANEFRGLSIKGVQVSIEGMEATHEAIRGKNTYAASMTGVKNFLDAGFSVTLNVTLSALNADDLFQLIDTASVLGVQRLGFSRLVPSGKGSAHMKKMLPAHIVKSLYDKIFSSRSGNLEIVTGDPVASQLLSNVSSSDAGDIPCGGCAAGVAGLTIMPDGTMVPCRRLNIPIGNIKKDSIREVWASSDVLNALRDRKRYNGKCRTCGRWSNCRGCRAIAYAYSGFKGRHDILADDPQCFFAAGQT